VLFSHPINIKKNENELCILEKTKERE